MLLYKRCELSERKYAEEKILSEAGCIGFVIKHEESGRPIISGSSLFVSISHSGELFTIIISDKPCGIDIQEMNENTSYQKIAERYFDVKTELSIDDFYDMWTKREAYFKAQNAKPLFDKSLVIPPASAFRAKTIVYGGRRYRENIFN
jgi:4'-phosphopantetheinyl transferase